MAACKDNDPKNLHITTDKSCTSCHQQQAQDWVGSDHDKAMQVATSQTVLGNFDNQTIEINGATTRFYKKNNAFWINTESGDGSLKAYKIEYTFGIRPLQQYLVKTADGKYQVLPLSWDSRAEASGGQRWFHIYGDDHVPWNDRLHWTQPLQNWNGMCADCHSTGLKRNYDSVEDAFDSHWDTINISCKSCHTEKLGHEKYGHEKQAPPENTGSWVFSDNARIAHWESVDGEARDQSEVGTCAACHSRRTPLTDGFKAGDEFLDSFSPSLVLPPDYFADGQIRDEVYVWGSFLQSKMYQSGVVCSDCHNPHSLEVKTTGNDNEKSNDLCATCHKPAVFDTPKHTHHDLGTQGADCVSCHMPTRTYMQVDERLDHSFRVPRPALSEKISAPNACTACHTDKTNMWAQDAITDWFDGEETGTPHYGEIFNDVLAGNKGAEQRLKALLKDMQIPEIIRASGYNLLLNYPNEDSLIYIKTGLQSGDPLLRLGAVKAYDIIPPQRRIALLSPLLSDKYRAIRIEAARALGGAPASLFTQDAFSAYQAAEREVKAANEVSAWRGEGRANVALFYRKRGQNDLALNQYWASTKVDPYFMASYVNLADMFRERGDEKGGASVLKEALDRQPDDADLNFALALNLIRQKRQQEALGFLKIAAVNAPANSRYAYVYSVALNDLGKPEAALILLEKAIIESPQDANLNYMLALIYQQKGDLHAAMKHAKILQTLFPNNEEIRNQVKALTLEK